MFHIKMVDLHKQYLRIKPEIDKAIEDVLTSTAFIQGPQVEAFADALGKYVGAKHVIPCGNGTDALQIAMMGKLPYTTLRDSPFAHPTFVESLNNLFSAVEG